MVNIRSKSYLNSELITFLVESRDDGQTNDYPGQWDKGIVHAHALKAIKNDKNNSKNCSVIKNL